MEIFAATTTLAQGYVGLCAVYLVGYWLVSFMRCKAKPHRDSLFALGGAALALWQAKQLGGGTAGYMLLFFAGLFATGALMVAQAVASKARVQAALR